MAPRALWLLLAAATAAVAAYLLTSAAVGSVLYHLVAAAGVAAVVVGIRRHRPAHARLWWLVAVGQAGHWAAEVVEEVLRRGLNIDIVLGPVEVLHGAGYAAQAAALLLLARRRQDRDRATLIEASVVASAFALVSWIFVVKPAMRQADLGVAATVVSLGYPVIDLLLLILLIRLLTGGGRVNTALSLVAVSMALTLVGDYTAAWINRTDAGAGSWLVGVVNLAAYLVCGAAALHRSMAAAVRPSTSAVPQRPRPAKLAVLTAATLIAPGLLVWQAVHGGGHVEDALAIALGCAGMFLLVVGRMEVLLQMVAQQSLLLHHQAAALQQLAELDPLTGLPNRRGWNIALTAALEHSRRNREPVSLAVIDIDHFKAYNDTFGHQAGDQLLKVAAARWSARLRRVDLLARYGGEEFVLLLPGATADEAATVVAELRAVTPQDQTFSAGVACWDGVEPGESLFERADRALYVAKASGRDRVVCAGDTDAALEPTPSG